MRQQHAAALFLVLFATLCALGTVVMIQAQDWISAVVVGVIAVAFYVGSFRTWTRRR